MEDAPTARVEVRRLPARARYDRDTITAILDEGLVCHLGFVTDSTPYVLPTIYARVGDTLYVHGAPASRMLRTARDAPSVCLTVTLLDGLVLARSVFHHSVNYRSVVVVGPATQVVDPGEKLAAAKALVEHVCRGRWADARPPTDGELRATLMLRIGLDEASAKVRSGPPADDEEDLALPVWAGELPLRVGRLDAVADPALDRVVDVPSYIRDYRRSGW
jgi:nitroimidazol reductase NimA-like FMN-containing flavoprotein (pyridoxamine 5'-phosphate oxidase superfamily)